MSKWSRVCNRECRVSTGSVSPMTKISMGLRSLICLLPAETSDDHGHHGWANAETEQPGTSYTLSNDAHDFSYPAKYRKAARGRDRVSCSNGGAQMLACFRAGAINLIVHPAMAMGGQRQGASSVLPVTSLPRTAFLEDPGSRDDPTSPVVTCIGQVRKDKPVKPTPKNNAEVAELWSTKAKTGETQRRDMQSTSTPSSPWPSKWKQILGARGTVNPSQQLRSEENDDSDEFHIDLNRFGSAFSSVGDQAITPGFGHPHPGRTFPASTFLAKPVTTMHMEGAEARDMNSAEFFIDGPALEQIPVQSVIPRPRGNEEVLLWKRRNGACKPLTLELKRRVLKSDFK